MHCTFLKLLLEKLDIKDINLIYDRIENHAQLNKEAFDLVTARALGKLPLILELGIPMIKMDGYFVAYKSSLYKKEVEISKHALEVLGSQIEKIIDIKLPLAYGDRSHIIIRKKKKTNKMYPRPFAMIKKKPL